MGLGAVDDTATPVVVSRQGFADLPLERVAGALPVGDRRAAGWDVYGWVPFLHADPARPAQIVDVARCDRHRHCCWSPWQPG